jgi:hypothetical protein
MAFDFTLTASMRQSPTRVCAFEDTTFGAPRSVALLATRAGRAVDDFLQECGREEVHASNGFATATPLKHWIALLSVEWSEPSPPSLDALSNRVFEVRYF